MASADRTVLTESDIVTPGPLKAALDSAAGTDGGGGGGPTLWESVIGKPENFPPSPHDHPEILEAIETEIAPILEGITDAVAAKADIDHTHSWSQVTGKPVNFPTTVADVDGLSAALSDLTDSLSTTYNEALDGKADVEHANRHAADGPDPLTPADIGASPDGHEHSWGEVTDKPVNFPPSSHTHSWDQVTGKPVNFSPSAHAASHATGGSDPLTPADIGAVPATRFLTGAGSPNGAVSAPVGTEYTDTAATNGARKWYKGAGTGDTGWVVLVGDTGPRDISSYLTNGWVLGTAGFVSVRRIDTIVELTVERINSASAATNFLFGGTYPTGFRPPRNVRLLFHTHASVPEVRRGQVNTDVEVVNGMNSGQFYLVQLYTTDEPWPSTLPGTPL